MGFLRKLWDAHVQHYYPLSVTQLTNFEWYLLIWVLSIDETPSTNSKSNPHPPSHSRDDRIRRAIRLLPEDLRRHRTLESTISKDRDRAILLCTAHIGFNPFLIGQIMMMLYEEVTDHLFELDWYIRTAHPDTKGYSSGVEDIVAELQKAKDTWWPKQLWPPPPSPNGAPAEIVLCDACVLGKVIAAPTFLENLRTALLSRHGHRKERVKKYPKAERKSPRPPVLLSFVDEGIFTYDNAATMMERSSTLADEMLSARLEARKAWKEWERHQESLGLPTGRPTRASKNHVQQHQQKQDPQQRRTERKESTRKLTKPAGQSPVEEPPIEESPVEDPRGRGMRKVDSPWMHLTPTSHPTPSLDKESITKEIDALYRSWKARPSLPCSSVYSRDDVFPDIPPTAPLSIRKEPSLRRKPLPPDADVSSILTGRSLSPKSAPQSHPQYPYLRRKPLPPDSDVASIRSEQSTVLSYTASLRGRDKGKARMSVASEVEGEDGDYVPPREGVSWRRVAYGRPASIGPSKVQTLEYTTTVRSDVDAESVRDAAPAHEPGPDDTTWSLLLKSGM